MHFKIAYLKDHPEKIPELAKLWYQVLGQFWVPNTSIEGVEQHFHDHLGNQLIGSAFL